MGKRNPLKRSKLKPQSVGVRELKGSLSAYLREVKNGATLIVTEHDAAIAELRPHNVKIDPSDAVLKSWAESGDVQLPQRPKGSLPRSPLALPDGTAVQLIGEDRGDER